MRILFISALLVLAASIPMPVPLVPSLMGSLCAYAGTDRRAVGTMTALLFVIELLFGFDVGILSLSYLGTVLVYSLTSRFISLAPWSASDGWRPADAVRALAAAWAFSVCAIVLSVCVGALYGHGAFPARLVSELGLSRLLAVLPLSLAFLVVFRRMDIPFRKRIRFGQT
jgi:hypothetical protein